MAESTRTRIWTRETIFVSEEAVGQAGLAAAAPQAKQPAQAAGTVMVTFVFTTTAGARRSRPWSVTGATPNLADTFVPMMKSLQFAVGAVGLVATSGTAK